jgi:hypothetical protein
MQNFFQVMQKKISAMKIIFLSNTKKVLVMQSLFLVKQNFF